MWQRTFRQYWTGSGIMLLLVLFYTTALYPLFIQYHNLQWQQLWADGYFWHIIRFSFWQASLSTLLSLAFALLLARALFYQAFFAKNLILKLLSLIFVLPSLVAISGIIGIYGHSGWLAKLAALIHLPWQPQIYGLSGILITHLFFNIPLATQLFIQALHSIPNQQKQLAAQLNLRGWQFLRLIEFPYLYQQLLPVANLIFILCFTSFATVLTLGGSPKYTTLEVAIYQAITFDFDLNKAASYALIQFLLCAYLFLLSNLWQKSPHTQLNQQEIWITRQSSAVKIWQIIIITSALLFFALPLVYLCASALFSGKFLVVLQNPALWQAVCFSLLIAAASAVVAILLATGLLLSTRRLQWNYYEKTANILLYSGMGILAIPTLVLTIGLYLALQNNEINNGILFALVAFCNALIALPFIIRTLALPMNNNMIYYEKLCQSLNIQGWQRLALIEWQALKRPMRYAFALAMALSLGDFTVIALFGNQDFTSLPRLLYQQLGGYRTQEAAVTAFILLLFCSALFLMIERDKEK